MEKYLVMTTSTLRGWEWAAAVEWKTKIIGGAIKELRAQELEASSEKILKSPTIMTGMTVSQLLKHLRNNEEGPRNLWMIAPKSCTE